MNAKNATTDPQIDRTDAERLIRRRAQQALDNFAEAKARFAEDFAMNPKYAFEWQANNVTRAQTAFEWWSKIAQVLDARGLDDAIEYAGEAAKRAIDSFFGSNSTCLWTNALRRAEVEVYYALDRRDLRDLLAAAQG